MSIVLLGSTSGSCTLQEQAVAGITTLTLPTITGTVGVLVNGTVNAGGANPFNNTLSNVDFTNIPASVRRITIMFSAVSTNGGSPLRVQIGAGSIDTAATYNGGGIVVGGTGVAAVSYPLTSGFELESSTGSRTASSVRYGNVFLNLVTTNTWVLSSQLGETGTAVYDAYSGSKTLSSTLDRVRITTISGTETFDAGTINILYE
jgi:hypothetical protein